MMMMINNPMAKWKCCSFLRHLNENAGIHACEGEVQVMEKHLYYIMFLPLWNTHITCLIINNIIFIALEYKSLRVYYSNGMTVTNTLINISSLYIYYLIC